MSTILVSLPSGPGVVRRDDGSLVVARQADAADGTPLRAADPFSPATSSVDEDHCVVGGLLAPGAVSAEVVDDRGVRVEAAVGGGAYVAAVEQPGDRYEPIVCCRDADGAPVRRPWAGDYPSERVADALGPCPACGAIDYDEYTPSESWRGGRGGPDGTAVPNPVVSCRICGHEEAEGTFMSTRAPAEPEDEAAHAARMALFGAQPRRQWWRSHSVTLRATPFAIYAAAGWPAQLGGSASEGDQLTEVTVHHYDRADADPWAGDRARLVITTGRDESRRGLLGRARVALENATPQDRQSAAWPDVSRAALTLWLRARDRERRAATLNAVRSEAAITIDGEATPALMLSAPGDRWVAIARHGELTITLSAHDLEPGSLSLQPVSDPSGTLLGPEPTAV